MAMDVSIEDCDAAISKLNEIINNDDIIKKQIAQIRSCVEEIKPIWKAGSASASFCSSYNNVLDELNDIVKIDINNARAIISYVENLKSTVYTKDFGSTKSNHSSRISSSGFANSSSRASVNVSRNTMIGQYTK